MVDNVAIVPLTNRQVSVIRSTWDLVKTDLQGNGIALFKNIFAIAPAAYGLFSFLKDVPPEQMEHNADLQKHALGVMKTVGAAVDHADQMSTLGQTLHDLGERHVHRGVKPEHYPIIGQALIQTLGDGLKHHFTPEVKDAYVALYGIVTKLMLSSTGANAEDA